MNTLRNLRPGRLAVLLVALLLAAPAEAQFPFFWVPTGTGDWDVAVNWVENDGGLNFVPLGTDGDTANIANGGTAQVSNTPVSPGAITISNLSSLEILSGGSLSTQTDFAQTVTGNIQVGINGTNGFGALTVQTGGALAAVGELQVGQGDSGGRLTVQSGATVNVTGPLQAFGTNATLIDLLGTASVTASGSADINRRLQWAGPDVTFSAASLSTNQNSVFAPVITSATHSLLDITGVADLDGSIEADLSGAPSTAIGTTWDLIKAASVTGEFANVTSTGGSFAPGVGVFANTVDNPADSGATKLVQLSVESRLYLEVDTTTGGVTIKNSDTSAIDFDGYRIASAAGSLSAAPGTWNSLADQALGAWAEVNPSSTALNELQASGTTGVSSALSRSLGTPFAPQPTQLGEAVADLTFTYTTPQGDFTGEIVYTDQLAIQNNFTLIVDPTTGEAQIKNASGFTTSIDGYVIQVDAEGASLDSAGWDSLADQGVGAWAEVIPQGSTDTLIELNASGATEFTGGDAFNIGDLFTGSLPAGLTADDLTFEYVIAGDSETSTGAVLFQTLPALPPDGTPGDYDGDALVTAADYTVFRSSAGASEAILGGNGDGSGTVDPGDYDTWVANFGAGLPAIAPAAATVPEPTALAAALCGLLATATRRRVDGINS